MYLLELSAVAEMAGREKSSHRISVITDEIAGRSRSRRILQILADGFRRSSLAARALPGIGVEPGITVREPGGSQDNAYDAAQLAG